MAVSQSMPNLYDIIQSARKRMWKHGHGAYDNGKGRLIFVKIVRLASAWPRASKRAHSSGHRIDTSYQASQGKADQQRGQHARGGCGTRSRMATVSAALLFSIYSIGNSKLGKRQNNTVVLKGKQTSKTGRRNVKAP